MEFAKVSVQINTTKGQTILDLVDTKIALHSINLVLGQSGSGKSTFLKYLTGSKGFWDGLQVFPKSEFPFPPNTKFQYVFQDSLPAFRKDWTILRSLLEPFLFLETKLSENQKLEILEEESEGWIPIGKYKNAFPSEVSGGELQRLALLRSLTYRPTILLLDEITSALDPISTNAILQKLIAHQRLHKETIVFVTHSASVVQKIGDYVSVFENGTCIEQRVAALPSSPK